jgi:diaminopimelate epimerase
MTAPSLKLLKMQATGNDFLIADCSATGLGGPHSSARPQLAKKLCDRIFGFGADGFLVIEKNPRGYFWDFYNSDGSSAAMCGNAARAVGRYLIDSNKTNEISFHASIGPVKARLIDANKIHVEFDVANLGLRAMPWHQATFVDTGVPHAVVKSSEDPKNLAGIAKDIKQKFGADGINVTFYSPKENMSAECLPKAESTLGGIKDQIEAITHERGVEDFTLSCGTGALAAAYVHLGGKDGDVVVKVPGGILNVTFKGKTAILRGEAHYVGWCQPIESFVKPE